MEVRPMTMEALENAPECQQPSIVGGGTAKLSQPTAEQYAPLVMKNIARPPHVVKKPNLLRTQSGALQRHSDAAAAEPNTKNTKLFATYSRTTLAGSAKRCLPGPSRRRSLSATSRTANAANATPTTPSAIDRAASAGGSFFSSDGASSFLSDGASSFLSGGGSPVSPAATSEARSACMCMSTWTLTACCRQLPSAKNGA
mmetsp:Transcript_96497/g.295189  ORF Transcript_96497/g.295189 Transcript_96497/m.295189 type:complete len:200 (-) Transcript_96497:29-628(-)